MKKNALLIVFLAGILALTACQPLPESTETPAATITWLIPYSTVTRTPTITPPPPDAPTATLAPTVTPTPRVYEVKANDTLIVIAFRNGLTLAELQEANPEVNPLTLSIGTKLIIPAAKGSLNTQVAPTPTPAPVFIHPPACTPSLTGGSFCFALVENREDYDVENLIAEFRLTDPESGDVVTRKAYLPLNKLQQGKALPFFAYYPPPVIDGAEVTLQLMSATGTTGSATSSYSLIITDPVIKIREDGLSAEITGTASLVEADRIARSIWIAAVAYDSQSGVVGVRRYEETAELKTGRVFEFKIIVYSTGGRIMQVELFGEGQP